MVGSIMNILGGSEKIIFGTDWPASPADLSVKAVIDLQIPKELQEGWGYPPITEQDRANMLGLNLAKMLKVAVPRKYRRRVKKGGK
jgi:predicted TIM-barrel fold metal-dependent hydrolase